MSMNDAFRKADTHVGIDENEVEQIIKSIKEAQYFDAGSMAPLTPASLVSILDVCLRMRL